ncbi:hypothetical protein SKAU_G00296180 [Synaphobranchus kaupii]|uniref:Uncharacterized protein n=1 Tax=Synaphobranchus kaupii TaxID=118154 RepID=A0A9Q1EUW1_SYNKA|nr:hypothetical protein SKAU_G00296180 [Synaphobranchus kaupii]
MAEGPAQMKAGRHRGASVRPRHRGANVAPLSRGASGRTMAVKVTEGRHGAAFICDHGPHASVRWFGGVSLRDGRSSGEQWCGR